MKFLALCLVLLASLAFASASDLGAVHTSGSSAYSGGTDADVYSQPYAFADLANGIRHYLAPEGWACDDFMLTSAADIIGIKFYIVYAGDAPTSYSFAITQDGGSVDPNTATPVWSAALPCTLVDTGDDNWGYDVYEVTCDIPSAFPSLTAGTTYWFAIGFHGADVTDYVLVTETITGSEAWSGVTQAEYILTSTSFGTPYDIFFTLDGVPTSLSRSTWGAIKSFF